MSTNDPVSADTRFVEVDLKDSAYRRLAKFASRIEKLLAARPTNPHLRDTLDLFSRRALRLGAGKNGRLR
jgi:hypothetical protein